MTLFLMRSPYSKRIAEAAVRISVGQVAISSRPGGYFFVTDAHDVERAGTY